MAKKAFNNADEGSRKRSTSQPTQQKTVTNKSGSQPKARTSLSGTGKANFNKDQPGGPTANSTKGKSANPGTAKAQNVPKSAVENRDVDGAIPNTFQGSRAVAPQKSYPTTPLRDGTGAKGAKGK